MGISGRSGADEARQFIDGFNVGEFDHVFDEDLSIWAEFGVLTQPAFVFLDAEGNATVVNGAMGADGLRSQLASL